MTERLEPWATCPACRGEGYHLFVSRYEMNWTISAKVLDVIDRECRFCGHVWWQEISRRDAVSFFPPGSLRLPDAPDRDPYNPTLHDAVLSSRELYLNAVDNLTHYYNHGTAHCGSTGRRLSMNWALVSCPDCRTMPALTPLLAASPAAPPGCYPVGYSFKIRGKAHTVMGHREIGYGQIGHDIDCDGLRCFMATEYIRDYGSKT